MKMFFKRIWVILELLVIVPLALALVTYLTIQGKCWDDIEGEEF